MLPEKARICINSGLTAFSGGAKWEPGKRTGPISLWDMLSNFAHRLIHFTDEIDKLQQWAQTRLSSQTSPQGQILKIDDKKKHKQWKQYFNEMFRLCLDLGLRTTPSRIGMLLEDFDTMTASKRIYHFDELQKHVRRDLKFIFFESVSKKKEEHYNDGFSKKVQRAFPSAVKEIREAGTCYALDRNTACVFHLMRAAEHGLRALAVSVGVRVGRKGVPLEFEQWEYLINQIECKTDTIDQWEKGPIKTRALEFYKPLVADFHAFKEPIRNILMHARGDLYDATRASSVLFRVKECMERLAIRISERNRRKLSMKDFRETTKKKTPSPDKSALAVALEKGPLTLADLAKLAPTDLDPSAASEEAKRLTGLK